MRCDNRCAIATYRNAFLIYNPFAGRIRRGKRLIEDSVALMQRSGHTVKAMSTTGPGAATEMAKRCLDHGADLIAVAGGDGTINEAMNGMLYSNIPLAILPGGTANVLAMETGIGSKMLQAAGQIGHWFPERVSVGVHSDGAEQPPRCFLLMCGAGLDAHIVYNINAPLKAALGKVSYWIGGFSQLGRRFPEFEVEADGRTYSASFALASRVRNYGGDLEIARSITLLEDDFELVLFSGANSFHYLRYMLAVMTRGLDQVPGVTILRTKAARFSGAQDLRVYSQIDGEYAGRLPVTLSIIPRAVTLLLPQPYRSKRPAGQQDAWTTSHTP